MRLIQFEHEGGRAVAAVQDGAARVVNDAGSVYSLAREAADSNQKLAEIVARHGLGSEVDAAAILAEGRMLPPIDHPDAAHLHVTGTGLTHLGSAATRDAMHKSATEAAEE